MASVSYPEADVKTIQLGFSGVITDAKGQKRMNPNDWGFLTDPLIYQAGFPPSDDILQRFDTNADLILAPIRSQTRNGLLLLKRVWLVCSKAGNPINGTMKVYMKGNEPKDGSADAPDYQTTFQIKNGNIYIDVPHLLSEAFILRFQWTPDQYEVTSGEVVYGGTGWESHEWRKDRVRIFKILVDVEEYGERQNVTGEEYAEQDWGW